jgi:hypothetical protein
MSKLPLAIVCLMLGAATTASAQTVTPASDRLNGGPRVRPNDGRSATLLVEGIAKSPSIRRTIDAIEQSDLIVYIEMQPSLRKRVAGSLTWLTKTPQFRYVRISINPEQIGEQAIALLGHELHHALEVAREPAVVDPASLEAFYKRIGNAVGLHTIGWDTEGARDAGDEVKRELALARGNSRAIESIREFDPLEWHVVYRRARERAQ